MYSTKEENNEVIGNSRPNIVKGRKEEAQIREELITALICGS